MPPTLALLLGAGFIAFVLWYDVTRGREVVTPKLWIPTIWLVIIASRPVSYWLATVGIGSGPGPTEEGSPVDATFFGVLILLGLVTLSARRLAWGELVATNKCLVAFLIFATASVLWSDFPFLTFKRLLRTFGHLVMVLVVLTEPDAVSAFKTVMKRCAYVLLPLSLVLIKYFPLMAMKYDRWTGVQIISGVAPTKNMLGQLCLVTGLVFVWTILTQLKSRIADKRQFATDAFFLLLAIHLLYRVDSKTSLACLVGGVAVFLACGDSRIRERVGVVILVTTGAFFFLDWAFGIVDGVTIALGRDATWTNRSLIWAELTRMNSSWALGEGFDSFWLGDRYLAIQETFRINEAHNGYLEIILNLGLVGLILFSFVILSAYANCRRRLLEPAFGPMAMTLLMVAVVYNVAEAGFRGLTLIAFAFYFVAIDVPSARDVRMAPTPDVARSRVGVRR